jgi:hypothetical protein
MAIDKTVTKYCLTCFHQCHCDDGECKHYVGIGMSDKYTECGCESCNCEFPSYPDWG